MHNFLELWYAALAEPVGIVIQTNDRDALRQRLYKARSDVKDPDLDNISIVFSPTAPDEVWLVKKAPENGQAP